MPPHRSGSRILMYSHDSFGLGHLRRCREIAHHLVEARKDLTVLIISGSPIIGSFDFRARVDFVRVPGVVKLRNGEYTPLSMHLNIQDTLAIRESIIRHTAEAFQPDILIVDKEPLGLRGEMGPTLSVLKNLGTRLVVGIRDVMDDPDRLAEEWERKQVLPALEDLYDDIWVYGLPHVYDPLAILGDNTRIREKMRFTGYLQRQVPRTLPATVAPPDEPYILVTAGGGGDGEEMLDSVLAAYEYDDSALLPALVLTGPFLTSENQRRFMDRAGRLSRVTATVFESYPEPLMAQAAAVVAMGGYNTFCEILSFDRPAMIIPREEPRREQLIRASRAAELGLVDVLRLKDARDPAVMVERLKQLPGRPVPSAAGVDGLLGGLTQVEQMVQRVLDPTVSV